MPIKKQDHSDNNMIRLSKIMTAMTGGSFIFTQINAINRIYVNHPKDLIAHTPMKRLMFLTLPLLFVLCSCANRKPDANDQEKEATNRNNLELFIQKVWNEKDFSVIDSLFANSFVRQVNGVNLASNKNELTANLQVYFTGFPDLYIQLDKTESENDHIYIHWTLTGTHTGIFGELAPTGKKIKISGISRIDFDVNGKIEEEQVYYNELSLLQQMGHTLNPPVLE